MDANDKDIQPRAFSYKKGNPWLGVAQREEYEEFIAGNREGLEALRDAVNIALKDGKSEIKIPFTDYPGVILLEGDPREVEREKPKTKDWAAGIFSLLLFAALYIGGIFIVVYSARFIWKYFFG